ncbi:MAG: hypothetical protein ACE15C_20015 [Phycisphaerae bacterium]
MGKLSLSCAVVCMACAQAMAGPNYTWVGGADSTAGWSTAANWSPGYVPDAGSDVTFDSSATTSFVWDDRARTIGTLTYNSASDFTVAGTNSTVLTINSGVTTLAGSGTVAIQPVVKLGGDNVWNVAEGTNLVFASTQYYGSGYGANQMNGRNIVKTGGGTVTVAGGFVGTSAQGSLTVSDGTFYNAWAGFFSDLTGSGTFKWYYTQTVQLSHSSGYVGMLQGPTNYGITIYMTDPSVTYTLAGNCIVSSG